jgi:hypothetical protein
MQANELDSAVQLQLDPIDEYSHCHPKVHLECPQQVHGESRGDFEEAEPEPHPPSLYQLIHIQWHGQKNMKDVHSKMDVAKQEAHHRHQKAHHRHQEAHHRHQSPKRFVSGVVDAEKHHDLANQLARHQYSLPCPLCNLLAAVQHS